MLNLYLNANKPICLYRYNFMMTKKGKDNQTVIVTGYKSDSYTYLI